MCYSIQRVYFVEGLRTAVMGPLVVRECPLATSVFRNDPCEQAHEAALSAAAPGSTQTLDCMRLWLTVGSVLLPGKGAGGGVGRFADFDAEQVDFYGRAGNNQLKLYESPTWNVAARPDLMAGTGI